MTDLKEDFAIVITSLTTGVFAFLSWFYQSSIFGTVTGLVIGAGITFFVQTRSQKRIWKREYAIKTIEQVYSKLYGEVKIIVSSLKRDNLEDVFIVGNWSLIENDHRYFMVDEKFRQRLEQFYSTLAKYNSAISEFNWLTSRILTNSAKIIFNKEPENTPNLSYSCHVGDKQHSFQPAAESYLRRLQTLEQMKKQILSDTDLTKPITNERFIISFYFRDNQTSNVLPIPQISRSFEDDNIEHISAYWELCLKSFRESKSYMYANKEKPILQKEANDIIKTIEKRISEPWKI